MCRYFSIKYSILSSSTIGVLEVAIAIVGGYGILHALQLIALAFVVVAQVIYIYRYHITAYQAHTPLGHRLDITIQIIGQARYTIIGKVVAPGGGQV